MTQNNLGNAYSDLPTGDRGENLRRAIACYEAALRVYTEADFPSDWATTQNNLGNAYSDLPTGDRGENLRRAIACYEAALRVRTEADFPSDWARTQNNLGNAYRDLPTGDRGENLRRAIACYEAALRVYTERTSRRTGRGPRTTWASPTATCRRVTGARTSARHRLLRGGAAGLHRGGLPLGLGDDPEQPGRRLRGPPDG